METKHTEIIEKFLNNELDEQELADFKQKLKVDKQLQLELKLQQEIDQVIGDEDILDFRSELANVRSSMLDQKNKKPVIISMLYNKTFLVAASIVILAGVALSLFFMNNYGSSNSRLFAQYYVPYDSDISIRANGVDNDNLISNGMLEYERENFETAADLLLQSLLTEDSLNVATKFYLGISFIESGRFTEAENCFKAIIDSGNNFFNEQASWYLAMAYLGSGKQDVRPKIIELLKQIEDKKSDHANEASKLLRKLD